MDSSPLISVIMSTYNRSNILPYSIGSVLSQTRADFELLVIGDGCSDDSQAVVEGIGDRRIRWIGLEQNSGHQSTPNNVGLAHARGKYIAYLGHDDLWLPHHLEVCIAAIDSGSDLAFGLTLMVAEDTRGNFLSPVTLPYEPGQWVAPSSVVHQKSVSDKVGNWKHYNQVRSLPEEDLWHRIHRAGYCIVPVPRISVIKIAAAYRKDVYKKRSCEEQSHWQSRIRNEPDLEARELATCYISLRSLDPGQIGTARYKTIVRYALQETIFRIQRTLRKPFLRGSSSVERMRHYKGLRPKP